MICYPTFGGSGIVATELGLKLMERGHEVHFISYQLPERLKTEKDFIFHEVNVLSYPLFKYKPYTLVLASLLSKLFREEGIEIMHAHYAIPHSASLYLAKSIDNRMKIITTLHGTDVHLLGLSDAYKPVLEMCLNNHDALTTVSNFMKDFITKNYDVRKNIEVIYNFVDPEKFRPANKEDKDELVLCHVSNFRKVKRSPDVIRAFAKVYEKHKNIRVVHRQPPRGRARAGKTGFKYCLDQGADVIIEMDADFSHQPKHIPIFLKAVSYTHLTLPTN